MPRIPGSRRMANRRTICGRTYRRPDSRWARSWRAAGNRRPGTRGDWLCGNRRPGTRTLRGDWLSRHRWLRSRTSGSRPSGAFTPRSGRKLTGRGWRGTRAGQLRSTRLEPIGHRGLLPGARANPALELVPIDAGTGACARSRRTCAGSGTRGRKLPRRGTTRRGRARRRLSSRRSARGRGTCRRALSSRRSARSGRSSARCRRTTGR